MRYGANTSAASAPVLAQATPLAVKRPPSSSAPRAGSARRRRRGSTQGSAVEPLPRRTPPASRSSTTVRRDLRPLAASESAGDALQEAQWRRSRAPTPSRRHAPPPFPLPRPTPLAHSEGPRCPAEVSPRLSGPTQLHEDKQARQPDVGGPRQVTHESPVWFRSLWAPGENSAATTRSGQSGLSRSSRTCRGHPRRATRLRQHRLDRGRKDLAGRPARLTRTSTRAPEGISHQPLQLYGVHAPILRHPNLRCITELSLLELSPSATLPCAPPPFSNGRMLPW